MDPTLYHLLITYLFTSSTLNMDTRSKPISRHRTATKPKAIRFQHSSPQTHQPIFKLPALFVQQLGGAKILKNSPLFNFIRASASRNMVPENPEMIRCETKSVLRNDISSRHIKQQTFASRFPDIVSKPLTAQKVKGKWFLEPKSNMKQVKMNQNCQDRSSNKYTKKPFLPFKNQIRRRPPKPKNIHQNPPVQIQQPPKYLTPYEDALKYYRFKEVNPDDIQLLTFLQNIIKSNTTYVEQTPLLQNNEVLSLKKIFKNGFTMCSVNKEGKQEFLVEDILQGNIPNCSFVASLTSLADRYPEMISELILFKQNPYGFYVVRLFVNGEWRHIVVDDKFPIQSQVKRCFVKPKSKNIIWPMLLQKAYIKLHYSYDNVQNYSITHALMTLTGAPTEIYDLCDLNLQASYYIQNYVQTGFDMNHIFVCSSHAVMANGSFGLATNHAYSLLSTLTIRIGSQEIALLKLRNPWGYGVWNGPWSFKSKQWTQELKEKHNYTKDPADGSFYISCGDFWKYFCDINRCRIQHKFVNSFHAVQILTSEETYLSFKVKKAGKYVATALQLQRERQEIDAPYEPIRENSLAILRYQNGKHSYIDSVTDISKLCELKLVLEQGEYLAMISVYSNQQARLKGALTFYGEGQITMENKTFTKEEEQAMNLERYESFRQTHKGVIKKYPGIEGATKETYFQRHQQLGFIRICNPTKTRFLSRITIDPQHEVYFSLFYILSPLFDTETNVLQIEISPESHILLTFKVSSIGFTNFDMPEEFKILN